MAALPLVQAARNKREWLKTVGVLSISMILVTALWGAVVGIPATALAGIVGSRRVMGQFEQGTLLVMGLVMLVVALGELGLVRRFLPDIRLMDNSVQGSGSLATGGSLTRRAAIVGATMAATFGIACNKAPYLALLTYVALAGGIGYGVLALSAYGAGLASSIVVGALVLRPASRSARLARWLGAREETFHLVQGVLFAFMGGVVASFFWLRMGAYIPPA